MTEPRMTHTEAVMLCRYTKAACPQQAIDQYTPDVWHDLLGDLLFNDCKLAIKNLGKRQAFIAPAEIQTEVKRIRAKRNEAHPPLTPPANLTDEQERDWIRNARRRIGDGEILGETREVGTRTFAELKGKVPELPAPPPVKREPDAATCDAKRAEIRRELHEGRRPVEVAEPLDDDDPEARPAVAELGSGCAA